MRYHLLIGQNWEKKLDLLGMTDGPSDILLREKTFSSLETLCETGTWGACLNEIWLTYGLYFLIRGFIGFVVA
jgi:hypothetical protein